MGIFSNTPRVAGLLKSFGAERKGSVAMMVGISFPLLFVAAGGAVDYTNAVANTQKAQRAMDSVVLQLTRKDLTTIDIQDEGEKLFRGLLEEREIESDVTGVLFDVDDQTVSGEASLTNTTSFLGFIGMPTMPGAVTSKAIPPVRKPIEISLVLDVSGSMSESLNGAPRIERMKDAVESMFDTLDDELLPSTELSVAVVPYSSSVNVSSYRAALRSTSVGGQPMPAGDVWAAERYSASNGTDYTVTAASPSGNRVPFVPADEMNYARPTARLTALTDDIDAVRNTVNAMSPDGWTAGHIGMAWGVYTLSEKWKNIWPDKPKKKGDADKIIVLLSDGEFNTTHNIGAQSNSDGLNSDGYFQNVCNLAKTEGIIIYAVALKLDAASENKLQTCVAGSGGGMYTANSATDLSQAFEDIARRLGARRLTS